MSLNVENSFCIALGFLGELVRDKVNQEITRQHKMGRLNLPPLQPPGSLDGFEMFGFTSPAIVQVNTRDKVDQIACIFSLGFHYGPIVLYHGDLGQRHLILFLFLTIYLEAFGRYF